MVTKQQSTLTLKPKPKTKTKTKPSPRRRKTRAKSRKPKYLSLRLQLTATTPQEPPMPTTTTSPNHDHNKLINFFPLHPEHLMEQDKLDMSCIFSSCDDDQANTTLTGILCSDDEEDIEQKINIDTDKNSSPSSVNYADEERNLVRTAMRRNNINKSDHDGHEKWVSYNEVVDRKKVVVMRGMSSSSSSTTSCYYNNHHHGTSDHGHIRNNNDKKLVLKLDYEKIMKSWVNKGPLYICGNSGLDAPQPQTVPDIQDDDFFFPTSINGSTHDERDNGGNDGSWTVPQLEGDDALQVAGSSAVVHNREASVQRYKEKRRNRLFAKTIRYEVRKLNAEKRPRIKGRFVKRD